MNHQVLVTPHLLQSPDGPHVEPLSAAGLEIVYPPEGMNTLEPDNIRELLTPEIGAILASTEPLTRELLSEVNLRVIARLGVGYDSIDVDAATELGVAVTITPGTLEDSVAEQTLALLLALTRDVIGRDHEVRVGVWNRQPLPRLAGRTFGLVGLGRIGRAVVPRVKGLQMRVLVFDPHCDLEFVAEHGLVRVDSLDELLAESDVVSLHAPCTSDTESMIDAAALARMRPDAILLNTSRGGLVDEAALFDALQSGHLFGAGLDVFREEPLPVDSPLLDCRNVVTCTHMGGIDQDSTRLAGALAARCIAELRGGDWPTACVVNPDVRDGWSWS